MSGWVPIDKMLAQDFKHIKRPFSRIEAMFSYSVDLDNGVEGTIAGYATQWGWSRNKVRRFVNCIRTEEGHLRDRRRTEEGQAIRFIGNGLWSKKDRRRTEEGQKKDRRRYATIDPNPNPNPKDTPLTPQGGESTRFKNTRQDTEKKLQEALKVKIVERGLTQYESPLVDFFQYRMNMEKSKRYKTAKGLEALLGDVSRCIEAGLDPVQCLDEAMTREWLTPKLEYFQSNGGKHGRSRKNFTGSDTRPTILPPRRLRLQS